MATNIGPKIGIDGEAEYRKQINNIIQQAKTLDSEMKSVTSAFDENTKAEEKAQAISKTLTSQIENQENRVKLLADMVAKSAEKTGDNSTQTLKWQEALNNATAELNNMKGKLKNVEDGITDEGNAADYSADKTSIFGEVLKANLTSEGILAGVKKLGEAVKAMGTAIANGIKNASQAFTDTVSWADDLATLSVQTGISTDKLQELEYMSGLVDVDVSTIARSMAKLTKNMSTAQKGTGDAAAAFEALGVNITTANGELRSNDDVFNDVITSLGSIENETQRDAYAMAIFGKSAQDLNPLIAAGGDAIAGFAQEARDMGYVIDGDGVSALTKFQDSLDRLSGAAASMKRNLSAAVAPFLDAIAENVVPQVTELAGALAKVTSGEMTFEEFMAMATKAISSFGEQIINSLPTILETGSRILISLVEGIITALPGIVPQVVSLVSRLSELILDNLPLIFDAAIQIIVSLAQGIGQSAQTLIPAVISCILTIVDNLLDNIDLIIDAANELILGVIIGIANALPQIAEKIPDIIIKIVEVIINNLPKLIETGVQIIVALVKGIGQAAWQLLARIGTLLYDNILKPIGDFVSDMWDAGVDLIKGLWDGIKSWATNLYQNVVSFANDIIDWFKGVFGIHSPSKVMADLGENLSLGLAKGIEAKGKVAAKAMSNVLQNVERNTILPSIGGADINIGSASARAAGAYGNINIVVNGAAGQNVDDLANIVMYKMQNAINRKGAVFA